MSKYVPFAVLCVVSLPACDSEEKATSGSPLPGEGEGEGPVGEGEGGEGEGRSEGETGEGEGEGPVCACASDADCQDGNFCNGAETCDCECQPGTPPTCADEFECTEDRCADNRCVNVPAHARCGEGKICRPAEGGCVAPPACRDDAGCVPDDPCQTGACDPATRACTFAPFDGDGDGHAPRVCGGNDCDDSTDAVQPGREEACNQKDDNCDGQVDEGIDFMTSHSHCGQCDWDCREGEQCVGGQCRCPDGLESCFGSCVDLQTDHDNCGQCSRDCQEGEQCIEGQCRCPEGLENCGLGCIDTQTDRENCGRCDNRCPEDAPCVNGECRCPDGLMLCGDRCVDVSNDDQNCGACNNACAEEARSPFPDDQIYDVACVAGACRCYREIADLFACGEQCADLRYDIEHCGRCGNACDENAICIEGQCEACPGESMRCRSEIDESYYYCACGSCDAVCVDEQEVCDDGACVCAPDAERCGNRCPDFQGDAINCGECGNVCPWAEACEEGVCTCYDAICDGRCSMLESDPNHCGECNHRCGRDEWCLNGQCERCPADIRGRCNGHCTDFQFDPLNCGGCGNECNPYQLCEDSHCTP